MNNVSINIAGLPAVNQELIAEIRDPVSNTVIQKGTPFRDGTLNFPRVDPGAYELVLTHPNLVLPVLTRPIRVLPIGDTKISILIDPSKFRNTPIADVPDANLNPVIDAAKKVEHEVADLGQKRGGEAILAADWNSIASSIGELAQTVGELTRNVSPQGHNHPEYEQKLNELQSNFDTLLNTLSTSMAEIQRRLQLERLSAQATNLLLSVDQTDAVKAARKKVEDLLNALENNVTESPKTFSDLLRQNSDEIQRIVTAAIGAGGDPTDKKKFTDVTDALQLQPAKDVTSELLRYQQINRKFGVSKRTIV